MAALLPFSAIVVVASAAMGRLSAMSAVESASIHNIWTPNPNM
jgi:hypothetical protein